MSKLWLEVVNYYVVSLFHMLYGPLGLCYRNFCCCCVSSRARGAFADAVISFIVGVVWGVHKSLVDFRVGNAIGWEPCTLCVFFLGIHKLTVVAASCCCYTSICRICNSCSLLIGNEFDSNLFA
jgi:hypothetical protein